MDITDEFPQQFKMARDASRRIDRSCGELASKLFETAAYLIERENAIKDRLSDDFAETMHAVLSEVREDIEALEGQASLDEPRDRTLTDVRNLVIKDLSGLEDAIKTTPPVRSLDIVNVASDKYNELIRGVIFPVMLDEFAECDCDRRTHNRFGDHYIPAVFQRPRSA